ncbi:MAG TPA: PRC and DUF2382 domain-containing protein [Rubrobacteraceae bacterium]|nr:PRC and DUF2382 domain-containing protein [Rubrobacteraceae bacterium]
MAEFEERSDRFTAVEDRFAGYTVYDRDNDKIGKVDDLFLDENDQPEYFGVKMGFLGTRSTLIPAEIAQIDESQQAVLVSSEKQYVKDGPSFDDDREITPDFEREVRGYYGVDGQSPDTERGSYGSYYSDSDQEFGAETDRDSGEHHPGVAMGDREGGEFREHGVHEEGATEPGGDLDDQDELRVQRTEEELRAGTTEREAGRMNVRKRVRTDRESIGVPTKREEVHVERVPVDREAGETEIGDDEISVPITEEEVVVEKRPVVKEEIRLRKDVVEDEQVVEEDVRREEVDIDDATERRRDV